MKILRIVGLGVVIWGLSLLWPEVNHVLRPPLLIGLALSLAAGLLAYVLSQHLRHHRSHHSNSQDHPSRPISVAAVH